MNRHSQRHDGASSRTRGRADVFLKEQSEGGDGYSVISGGRFRGSGRFELADPPRFRERLKVA